VSILRKSLRKVHVSLKHDKNKGYFTGRIVCTLCVHCVYIVCTLFVHCVYIVCTLCVHCVYIACTLCVHCVYIACTLCVHCVYIVCTLRVHCVYIACTLCVHLSSHLAVFFLEWVMFQTKFVQKIKNKFSLVKSCHL
jgi:hypothetical protein